MIARVSIAAAYWIDVATFGAAILAVAAIAPQPPRRAPGRAGLTSIAEGSAT